MPTYDYKCRDCGHEFEAKQRMADDPLTDCPECDGKVERLLSSSVNAIVKGSGAFAPPACDMAGCCGAGQPGGIPPCQQ